MEIKFKGLKGKISPIYWERMMFNQTYIQIYFGGSSSSKSFSRAQKVILGNLEGRNTLVIRKVASTIKRSVLNEVVGKINLFKLNSPERELLRVNKSELTITNMVNRKQILFCGCDDPEKLKSIVPADGIITDIWIEEATELTYDEFKAILKRLRGISKFKKTVTLLFNPILKSHWIYKMFFEGFWEEGQQYMEKEGLSILKTTYLDNPYLAKEDIFALENEDDPYYKEVYTYGNWGILGAVVYKNWIVNNFNPDAFSTYRNGVDWGFSNDQFAFIRIAVDFKKEIIYICEEIYELGLLNKPSAKMVKKIAKREVVFCDSAEPKSIEEYNQRGVRAKGVEKGAGSVEEGIKFLQAFKIIIHPSCINFQNEIQKYRYKKNKNGEVLPQVVGKEDHLMDALRYAISTDLDKKEGKYSKILKARIRCGLRKKQR